MKTFNATQVLNSFNKDSVGFCHEHTRRNLKTATALYEGKKIRTRVQKKLDEKCSDILHSAAASFNRIAKSLKKGIL